MKNPLKALLLLTCTALAIYSNTFDAPFQFDDQVNIVENRAIKNLGYFAHPFDDYEFKHHKSIPWRYFGYLTFALNYELSELNPAPYRFVNIVIHILCGWLVFLLTTATFRLPFLQNSKLKARSHLIALFAGLLFIAHPLQTQAITYIVQRFAALSTLFYLLTLLLYLKFRMNSSDARSPTKKSYLYYGAAIISAILAMKSKEIAITLPLMLTLYELSFLAGGRRERIKWLLPFYLTTLLIPLSLINFNAPLSELFGSLASNTRADTDLSRLDYLLTQFRVVATYLRLLFLPINQNLDYDYPLWESTGLPVTSAALLLLLMLVFLAFRLFNNSSDQDSSQRLIAVGMFGFMLALSTESSLIPIKDIIFEHRLYLPLAFLSGGAVSAAFLAATTIKFSSERIHRYLMILPLMLLFTFALLAFMRNQIWSSAISLWEDVVTKSPGKARSYNNLGSAYNDAEEPGRAIPLFEKALALKPGYDNALQGLGRSYIAQGDLKRANYYLNQLKSSDIALSSANFDMANAHLARGEIAEALKLYQAALLQDPENGELLYNLGLAYHQNQERTLALKYITRAQKLQPRLLKTYHFLADDYLKQGLTADAIKQYRAALKIDSDDPISNFNLGMIYGPGGQTTQAITHFKAVLRSQPQNGEAHNNLGNLYFMQNDLKRARDSYLRSIEIEPQNQRAHYNLALVYSRLGQTELARKHQTKAAELKPVGQ